MSTVIKVENLSKQYRLGQVSTGTLMHDINRWFHKVRGLEDPYAKITGVNNRDTADDSEYVWALKDINFEVKQGEVLGIIGRNGAGKSTLLKILSKVTSPTTGQINVKGRIASLLEVGTGFHPELTGRENIFLNGAILGMTKTEIRSKFDEIVAFSGVEKYIDTPVKRYSSGMYVRLAFAVAAHLEPEILIVDEVLAVGDAEFQKKCLGKMKDVSGEGRTVLFVSHNMAAVESLCENIILLENGLLTPLTSKKDTLHRYLKNNINTTKNNSISGKRVHQDHGKRVKILKLKHNETFFWKENLTISISCEQIDPSIEEIEIGVGVDSEGGNRIFTFESHERYKFENKNLSTNIEFTSPILVPGKYFFSLGVRSLNQTLDFLEFFGEFSVSEFDIKGKHFGHHQGVSSGFIYPEANVFF
ncbi:MAG: ATP-binding cassette domain-containing protein [Bacteroidetes bacterium]|nr:ATP-binding cassette domain-containing protein [Bacteroidota bacterium]